MFTLTDTPVKFVGLFILFTFSVVWSLYQLARRQNGPTLVSNLAHLAMSVVMLLMVARTLWRPLVAVIPLPVFVGFFGVCVLWFVYLGVRGLTARDFPRAHAWHAFGHAAMFGAMTWHLAGMLVRMRSMSGMNHGGHGGHAAMEGPNPMMVVAWVGVPFMAYLLIASVGNLKNALAPSRDIRDHAGHSAAGHGHYVAGNPRLASLADFAMNFGMFWMSTGLMVALLPFFRYLAF